MRFYFGSNPDTGTLDTLIEAGAHNFLSSFADVGPQHIKEISARPFNFFLDSGAYSAWSRGLHIDLDEYIAFIKHHSDHIQVFANLDSIPGSPSSTPTPQEREEGAQKSWNNFLYMQSEGLRPLPVFHAGEDWKWLDKFIQHGETRLGIGGLVDLSSVHRKHWLDSFFYRLQKKYPSLAIAVHGFGMTAPDLIHRYPWDSVDSTAWLRFAGFGVIHVPALHKDGGYDFSRGASVVTVSGSNPKQRENGKTLGNLPQKTHRHILDWISHCGQSLQSVQDDYKARRACSIQYYLGLTDWKNTNKQISTPYSRPTNLWT
jgi:hypothetical protein